MTQIIDLSLPLTSGYTMQTPEGVKNIQLSYEVIKDYPGGAGQLVNAVHMRLHNGTHVDAPMHFVEGGPGIDAIPLSTFYGAAVLGDLTFVENGAPITVENLERALSGRPIEGTRVLLRTNWNHHYGEPNYAEGSPYISPEAVDWIVERRPVLVSYDYMHGKESPDAPPSYSIKTFTSNGIVTMGYVRNLDQIDAKRSVLLAAFPIAFIGVESSPVRAVAIQEDA